MSSLRAAFLACPTPALAGLNSRPPCNPKYLCPVVSQAALRGVLIPGHLHVLYVPKCKIVQINI